MMKDAGNEPTGLAYETAEPKKWYPRLTLDLEKFPELATVGKEVTLTVKGCVTGVRKDEQGGTVDFEVYECGVEKEKDEGEADKELSRLKGA